ncbi:MAG: hypothetical protein HZA77_10695 [Candidatus Schekmanbacteria bacterium]|nr:hypothetical protein [Candidatus Schekmanbacteria bacterium]
MASILVLHDKYTRPDGNIVEMKIWKVPASRTYPQGYKYSLVYIVKGERIIGYDNAEGKGHHRHSIKKEDSYNFKNISKLISDFFNDIIKIERDR